MIPIITASVIVLVMLLVIMVIEPVELRSLQEGFWTQYGGAIPADEQARRFDAAGKGVPDMAWAEAYLPPNYCHARPPPPVAGEPARPPFRE